MSCCRQWATVHATAFGAALVLWTVALLSPVPHESAEKVLGGSFGVFLFAKSLHVGTYAGLTVLGGTVAMFGRKWVWVLPGLIAHGALTEFFQQFTGRTARIEDVGLDTLGIAIGASIVWAVRSITPRRPSEAPSSPE